MNGEVKGMKEMIRQAASVYTTPFYLFNLERFTERIRQIQEILGQQVNLCYAVKANPFLISVAADKVKRLEVCSPGEFAICEKNGISMDKIVLSGVYKEEKEIRRILSAYGEKGIYTIESPGQLKILAKVSEEIGIRISVLLRLTSGNQFGMDAKKIHEIIRDRSKYSQLQIRGIQYYSGTQKKQKKVMEKELTMLDVLCEELKDKWGFHVKELEYGPGFFFPYFQKDDVSDTREVMTEFRQILDRMKFQGKVTLEIGRYLAADCGVYVTRIVDLKENDGKKYAIVDGGIHHLNYYGQTMAMKIPFYSQLDGNTLEERNRQQDVEMVTVCGALCTVSDVLVKNLPLTGEILGDILVFENTGAYSVTEGIYLFLSRAMPQILFWSENEGLKLIREPVETSKFNSEMKR